MSEKEGQAPRWQARLTTVGEEVDEVFVVVDGAEFVAQPEVGIAFGEGGPGHTGGLFRNGMDGAGLE